MNSPKINVTLLVDRSGSMAGNTLKDHVGGMRSFIKDQQKQVGETLFNFIQFDDKNPFEIILDGVNIDTVDLDKINLHPRGGTPLLDAVGKTINHIEEQERVDKSDQVIFMIITDGEENMSREWKRKDIKHLINEKKDDWSILFLGADLDKFDDAREMGFDSNQVVGVNAANIKHLYGNLSSGKLHATRGSIAKGDGKAAALAAMSYNASDRTFGDNSEASFNINKTVE